MADAAPNIEKIRSKFLKEVQAAESYRSGQLEPQWEKFWNAYMGMPEAKNTKRAKTWRSRQYVKHMFQQVQTLLVEFIRADTELDFIPDTQADLPHVDANEKIIASQLYEDGWDARRPDATVTTLVYGGQPVLTTWDYAEINRKEQVPGGAPGQAAERKVTVRDRPTHTLIDPEHFLHDPTATELDKRCRYAGYQYFASTDDLEQLAAQLHPDGTPVYQNLDQLKGLGPSRHTGGASKSSKWIGRSDEQRPEGLEVIPWYSRNPDGSLRLQVWVERSILIRDEQVAPQWHLQEGELPFTMLRVVRDPKKMYGLSIVWSSKEIQDQIWTLMNTGTDALRLRITPFMWKNKNDRSLKDVEIKPGGSAWSEDPQNAMVPFKPDGVENFVTQQAIDSLVAMMERMTGANAALAGEANSGSATESANNLEQSKGRVGLELKQFDMGVARMVGLMRSLNRQYLSPTEAFRLAGPDGVSWMGVTADAVNANMSIRPKGSADRALMNQRQQNAQNRFNALMPAMQNPNMPDGSVFNAKAAIQEFLDANNVPNAKDYFVQPPPPPPPAAPAPDPNAAPPADQNPVQKISESINFKDLPSDAQAALLSLVGLPSQGALNPPPPPPQIIQPGGVNGPQGAGPLTAGAPPSSAASGQ